MAETAIPAGAPALEIRGLTVHYGHAPALQGVDLTLARGVLAVVGRNGMGKTTTCNAITGLVRASGGSIKVYGREVLGLSANRIVQLGIGYAPQGRRVWPSLSVHEHLRLAARGGTDARWTVERVYDTFPQLKERRRNGGAQLSGGEQQMLAIGRALLANPRLLVMDEPSEGLAPIVVQQLSALLQRLVQESELTVLLIEQNIGVATSVSERVAIMMNGRIARELSAAELAGDSALQQRLLGVGRHDDELEEGAGTEQAAEAPAPAVRVLTVRRRADAVAAPGGDASAPVYSAVAAPTRWTSGNPLAARRVDDPNASVEQAPTRSAERALSIAEMIDRRAYVAGTFDTKGKELGFLLRCLERLGLECVTVDLSTSGRPSAADVGPREVALHHPRGAGAVFSSDRGEAVTRMAEAFERFILTRRDLGGIVSAGGSGGTALATPAMRALPVGLPKVMVSTVASGDVKRYVGPSDIMMMYSVTDVQGINRISEQVLSNAAHALAGMIAHAGPRKRGRAPGRDSRPAIGLTMFGVTTPCVQETVRLLEADYDCLVFHATGTGGQSMEKLVDSHLLAGVIDVTTTEIPDLLVGGVFPATEDRLGAIIRSGVAYVGSCGALDMVNFGPMESVPAQFRGRSLYVHNPQVTLMRTTAEECAQVGGWIAERLNRMNGPVRFLIPERGVSLLDAPGQPFHDPDADRALFSALEQGLRQSERRRLVRLPHNINDPAFAEALVRSFREITQPAGAAHATL